MGNSSEGQQIRRLKKGELLFSEGEKSRAMYLLRSGAIRLFLKKGENHIEIDTVRSGQILGELAFLDGNPRSVSGEALTECELLEISAPAFVDVIARAPDWLKILLKTVVSRLRAAITRLRQLEASTVILDYSDKDGGKKNHYQFLTWNEFLKVCSSIVLTTARKSKTVPEGIQISAADINFYSYQVMGVPVAKTDVVLDILSQNGAVTTFEAQSILHAYVKDLPFIEKLIRCFVDEVQAASSRKREFSERGLFIMDFVLKNLDKFQTDKATGITHINLSVLKKSAPKVDGSDIFREDEAAELVRCGFFSNMEYKSATEVWTTIKSEDFLLQYKFMQILEAINALNLQKRGISGAVKRSTG